VLVLLVAAAAAAGLLAVRLGAVQPPSWLPLASAVQHPWADGACVTQNPTGPGKHATVFIDPGHGSPDPGTSGYTTSGQQVFEKDLTLATARLLSARLRAAGYRVVMARVKDASVASLSAADVQGGALSVAADHRDLVARVACANAAHAQVLVSIHFNGFSDPGVGGTETFYDDARPFSARNEAFATLVQQDVVAQLAAAGWQEPDRGVQPDSSDAAPTLSAAAAAYDHLLELGPAQRGYLDTPSAMPGALIEPLFLTNVREATIAASPRGQDAIAHGLELAIEQFLSS